MNTQQPYKHTKERSTPFHQALNSKLLKRGGGSGVEGGVNPSILHFQLSIFNKYRILCQRINHLQFTINNFKTVRGCGVEGGVNALTID